MQVSEITSRMRENTVALLTALNADSFASAFEQITTTDELNVVVQKSSEDQNSSLQAYRQNRDRFYKRFWEVQASMRNQGRASMTKKETADLQALEALKDSTYEKFLQLMAVEEVLRGFRGLAVDVDKLQSRVSIYMKIRL